MLSELPELPAGKIKINRRQLDRRTAGSMKSRQIGIIIKCLGLDLEFVTLLLARVSNKGPENLKT